MARIPSSISKGTRSPVNAQYSPDALNMLAAERQALLPGMQTGQNQQPQTLAQRLQNTQSILGGKYDYFQAPKYAPNQLGIMQQFGQNASENLPNLGNLSFDPIQKYHENQFKEDILPQYYGAYSGQSGGNLGYGGDLLRATEKARGNLQLGLAAQRQNFELSRHGALLKQAELGLRSPYENLFAPNQPEGPTWWEKLKHGATEKLVDFGLQAGGKKLEEAWNTAGGAAGIAATVAQYGSVGGALAAGALSLLAVKAYQMYQDAQRNQ